MSLHLTHKNGHKFPLTDFYTHLGGADNVKFVPVAASNTENVCEVPFTDLYTHFLRADDVHFVLVATPDSVASDDGHTAYGGLWAA